MFCIKLGGIPIGIVHRYPYVRLLCRGYETTDPPVFTVQASEEEIKAEQDGETDFSEGYCESLCLYRKICRQLPRYDAFLIHASVVAVDGEAYVFTAPSGTGKTTHTRLWLEQFGSRAEVVNGDKPIVRFMDGRLHACGTPWQGKEGLGENIIRPVRAICFLEQSPTNNIRLLDEDEVCRRLFHQLLMPVSEQELDWLWPLLDQLLTSVDFYLLRCNREPESAQLAYQTMRRKKC